MLVDLRVAQLLCSRLCHDLAGPIGAVNAGLELLGEDNHQADISRDALALTTDSSRQLSRRLAFFRMAFGLGGGASGAADLGFLHGLTDNFMAEGGVRLDWPVDGEVPSAFTVPGGAGKLLLNLILLARETLPRGGTLSLRFAVMTDGNGTRGLGVAMTASGRDAHLRDEVREALNRDCEAETLTARTVLGHFIRNLADSVGTKFEISDAETDEIRLAVFLPGR
jgi:histidine phosphotransferase ChpT